LLALAKYLNETRNFDGLIRLIFQPAEEGGRGAFMMLKEGLLTRFPFDEIYGYHNWPYIPRGTFAITAGPMLAAVDDFEIVFNGKGGHAAMPHLTHDVIPAIAQLVLSLQTLVSRETDPTASAVISVTNMMAGTGSTNVISETARISGTVRTFREEIRANLEKRIRTMAIAIADSFEIVAACQYLRQIDPVINDPQSTLICREAAVAIAGEQNVFNFPPIMGGEDFGGFLLERPGAFIAVGQKEENQSSPHNCGLHSPGYDFNDAIIPSAAAYFAQLAESRLSLT
jgi:hippurate hydrolase